MVETMHAQWKIAKIGEKQHRAAKMSALCRTSVSMNLATNFQSEIKLTHLITSHAHTYIVTKVAKIVSRAKQTVEIQNA